MFTGANHEPTGLHLMLLKWTIYILRRLVRPYIKSRFIGLGRFRYKEACLDESDVRGGSLHRKSEFSIDKVYYSTFFLHGA